MKTRPTTIPASSVRFDIDPSLGRLAKWLRILGFDTAYPCKELSSGRFFVTTRPSPGRLGTITVQSEDVFEQLKQLLGEMNVAPDPDLFFSRCLLCNKPVIPVAADEVTGRVPDSILELAPEFNECPRCGRVYWEGSHYGRVKAKLKEAGVQF